MQEIIGVDPNRASQHRIMWTFLIVLLLNPDGQCGGMEETVSFQLNAYLLNSYYVQSLLLGLMGDETDILTEFQVSWKTHTINSSYKKGCWKDYNRSIDKSLWNMGEGWINIDWRAWTRHLRTSWSFGKWTWGRVFQAEGLACTKAWPQTRVFSALIWCLSGPRPPMPSCPTSPILMSDLCMAFQWGWVSL